MCVYVCACVWSIEKFIKRKRTREGRKGERERDISEKQCKDKDSREEQEYGER